MQVTVHHILDRVATRLPSPPVLRGSAVGDGDGGEGEQAASGHVVSARHAGPPHPARRLRRSPRRTGGRGDTARHSQFFVFRSSFFVSIVLTGIVSCGAGQRPVAESSSTPAIQLNQGAFEVSGFTTRDLETLAEFTRSRVVDWQALFAIYVDDGTKTQRPAVLGSYSIEHNKLRFTPRFPLVPGVRYRALFDPAHARLADASQSIEAEFVLPKPATAAGIVEHIYPSRSRLPENQLKFYIHFSVPMSRGEAYDNLQLLDAAGKPIELAFLELGEELWDPAGKRFTLFFDPGRIKRGLKPREDLGPILEEGKSYTLAIGSKWSDADGNPLKQPYRKTFTVGAPDDEPIDAGKWRLTAPAAGTSEPLTVIFPEPLDHALLQRLLWVIDAGGQKVAGAVRVADEETRWQFTPTRPWQMGRYQLVADTSLEDLAGNKIGQPFEVDVFKPIEPAAKAKTVMVPFTVNE